MSVIPRLTELFRLRMYDELEIEIDQLIRMKGWDQVIQNLRLIWDSGDYISWNLSYEEYLFKRKLQGIDKDIPRGTIRDGLTRVLGLESISGIDVDLLDAFADLSESSLDSVKEESYSIGKEILKNQIERGDTFFLDIKGMLITPYFELIDKIVTARSNEMLQVGDSPTLKDVVSTYYGFIIAIEGVIDKEHVGISKEVLSCIENLTESFGGKIKINGLRVKNLPSLFPKCSVEKATLLANLLTIGIGGKQATKTAIRNLHKFSDSRCLELLIRKLKSPSAKQYRTDIIDLLAGIGHPSAFEVLRDISQLNHDIAKNATVALSYIRHPESLSYLMKLCNEIFQDNKKLNSGKKNRLQAALSSLGNTRDPKVLPILEKALYNSNVNFVIAALTSLTLYGQEGDQIIVEHLENITKIMREFTSFPRSQVDPILRRLLGVPSILKYDILTDTLSDIVNLEPDSAHQILKIFNKFKTLEIPSNIIEACITSLEKSYYFMFTLEELRIHPLLDHVLEYPRLGEIVKKRLESQADRHQLDYPSSEKLMSLISIPILRKDRRVLDGIVTRLAEKSRPSQLLFDLIINKYQEVLEDPQVRSAADKYRSK